MKYKTYKSSVIYLGWTNVEQKFQAYYANIRNTCKKLKMKTNYHRHFFWYDAFPQLQILFNVECNGKVGNDKSVIYQWDGFWYIKIHTEIKNLKHGFCLFPFSLRINKIELFDHGCYYRYDVNLRFLIYCPSVCTN